MLLELQGCKSGVLDSVNALESALCEAAVEGGAQVVKTAFHQFSPVGISGVVIISESHITVHSWPEIGYAAVDIFTCGDPQMPERVRAAIERRLQPKESVARTFTRGTLTPVDTSCIHKAPAI